MSELYQEIGKLTTQVNWLKKNLVYNLTPEARRALVERDTAAELPILWQAELLSVSRASLYYQPRPAQDQEIAIKHLGKNFVLPVLDELYTRHPFLGSRKIARMLAGEGLTVGRHTQRNGSAI